MLSGRAPKQHRRVTKELLSARRHVATLRQGCQGLQGYSHDCLWLRSGQCPSLWNVPTVRSSSQETATSKWRRPSLRRIPDHCVCHLRVPLMDHSQAVSQTGPNVLAHVSSKRSTTHIRRGQMTDWRHCLSVSLAKPSNFVKHWQLIVGCCRCSRRRGEATRSATPEQSGCRALLGGRHKLGLHKLNVWDAKHSDPLRGLGTLFASGSTSSSAA